MLKKLTNEKLVEVLEAGIGEFADHGVQHASMSAIAKRSGISVGALYKYFDSKDAFFSACVRHCTSELDRCLQELFKEKKTPLEYAEMLIRAVQRFSRQHREYIRLYHEVTCTGDETHAALLAQQIEGVSSRLYTEIIRKAQEAGEVRCDLDPRLFAFFFDNLLMMMQFSYCCPYYQERFKLYTGEEMLDDTQLVTAQLLRFLESAFILNQADSLHK